MICLINILIISILIGVLTYREWRIRRINRLRQQAINRLFVLLEQISARQGRWGESFRSEMAEAIKINGRWVICLFRELKRKQLKRKHRMIKTNWKAIAAVGVLLGGIGGLLVGLHTISPELHQLLHLFLTLGQWLIRLIVTALVTWIVLWVYQCVCSRICLCLPYSPKPSKLAAA